MRLVGLAVLMMTASCALTPADAMPVVTGAFGSKPVIELPVGRPAATPRLEILTMGMGPRTRPGDVVLADVEIRTWAGNRAYSSTYDVDRPVTVVFDRHVAGTWRRALVGRRAGSRVMLVGPAAKVAGPGVPAGIPAADTLVLVFDVLGGYPPDARRLGGTLPDLPSPLRRPAHVLIGGSGAQVRPGARVVAQYVHARGRGGPVVDSSAARGGPGAFVLKPGAVPAGWVEGLTGQRVGSRVAVTAPGGSIYVIDIIDMV